MRNEEFYISDIYFYVFIIISASILLSGIGFLFLPGVFLFLISDSMPSLFLDHLHGDYILPGGAHFTIYWPFVALCAFMVSKREITNLKKIVVRGKFNILRFCVLLIMGSMGLAAEYHMRML
jgi:hypothetical protein